MSLCAEGHRHIATLWRGGAPWKWVALKYGYAQPQRFVWLPKQRAYRFHFTPFHFETWGSLLEVGICFGKRTLCVVRHR